MIIILLGLLSAWEEINELYRDGSWKRDMFYSFLFWETSPKWKNFDSKHTSFGAFALVMFIYSWQITQSTAINIFYTYMSTFLGDFTHICLIVIQWWFFFYIRNLGLHIVLRRKGFRQYKYFIPIQL